MKKNLFFYTFALTAFLSTGLSFTACSSDDDNNNNSGVVDPSTIATDSLVAYFPFDGSGVDEIAALTPSNTNAYVTYVDGKRGQCYQGDSLAYLLYTLSSTSKLALMTKGITISCWMKPKAVSGTPTPNIVEIGYSDDLYWGNFKFYQERVTAGGDSCYFKCQFRTVGGQVWAVAKTSPNILADKWAYYSVVYDGTNSTLKYYKNGVILSEMTLEATNAGLLSFTNVNNLVIGGWLPKISSGSTDEWQGWFQGNMDELRIYNAPLSANRVKDLYNAEVSELD
jgi:hypothetical protein